MPIVEPEVLMDGAHSGHTIERCYEVTEWTQRTVFRELYDARVALEGIVLKPNMVIAGQKCPKQASAQQVAELTVKCLKATVPAAVPGIAFLSGGQSDEQATENLSLINQIGDLPWKVTFSYGRALQAAALKAWGGKTRERRRRPARLHPPRAHELAGGTRQVEPAAREGCLIPQSASSSFAAQGQLHAFDRLLGRGNRSVVYPLLQGWRRPTYPIVQTTSPNAENVQCT